MKIGDLVKIKHTGEIGIIKSWYIVARITGFEYNVYQVFCMADSLMYSCVGAEIEAINESR